MSCPPPTPALHRCELSWDEQAAAEPWSVRPRGQGQPGATRLEGSRDSSGQLKESHRVPQWAGKRPPHISRLSDPPTAFKAQHTPRPRGGRPGMPLATPQGPVQGSPHARPEAGTQPRPSALQPTGPPAACRGHGPRTPSPCSLAHPARPPPTPPCDDRRGGVSQLPQLPAVTALPTGAGTAGAGRAPAPHTATRRSRPRRPSGERLVPRETCSQSHTASHCPPTGRSPGRHTRSRGCGGGLRPAPRRAGRGTRLPGANAGRSRSVAAGHGAGWRRLSETAPVGKPAAAPVLRAAASPFSPDHRGRSGPSPTLTA